MGLAVVRDLRELRAAAGPEEIERFETDVFAGFVLARCVGRLVGQHDPLRCQPPGAGADLVRETVVGHGARRCRRLFRHGAAGGADRHHGLARAQALKTYFEFLELRHKVEIHELTGRVVECPIDEMNRPRGRRKAKLRIPPAAEQIAVLFAGWRGELATCRKFGPDCPQLRRGPVDVRGGAAGQRGPSPGPGRHQVGAGPVRQAPCPPWQRRPGFRARASGWCR